ncbi:MAG: cellobiose 2-epimerase [Saprospiraceae bacterium]|nr:MAG: cellobiose 2-epimerase [Saprospiraceae bacterium]
MSYRTQDQRNLFLGVSIQEIEKERDDLLHSWYPRIVDTISGGYWTNFEYDWTPSESQSKMLVTQARGLWTAARAAQVYPQEKIFRQAAAHGFTFLTKIMWDEKQGGFSQYYPGSENDYQLTYGNAFALYAMAEYAKINPDPAVLTWLEKSFVWLEEVAHDPEHLGYFNLIYPEGLADSLKTGANWGDPLGKDQNSSIHILEALTNVYQVWPDELVKKRLAEIFHLVRDTMVHADGYLRLFYTQNWQPINHQDSTRDYILEHLYFDHRSFGHDIETAYLLLDASKVLYGKYDLTTLAVAKKLVHQTLANGFDQDYYGLFDRAYQFPGKLDLEIVNKEKNWWGQAEAWHTLALMSTIYPKEAKYQEAFQSMWRYIKSEMIDYQYGGWYNNGLDTDPANKTARKAHEWKSAYHNGRALMQVLEYR